MTGRVRLRERYDHCAVRFVVERQLVGFLEGVARQRAVWDLGCGAPPVDRAAALRTLDRDRSTGPSVCADLDRLPFADASLQGAVSIAVLEHVRRPERVVAELGRALAPGAPLFVWVPFLHEVHLYPVDLWRFTDQGLRELMEGAGLETVSCTQRGLTGWSAVAAHVYRFLVPPTPPRYPLKLAGFALVGALRWLDRWLPLSEVPIGTTWIGHRKPEMGAETLLSSPP